MVAHNPRPVTIQAALRIAGEYIGRYGWTRQYYLYDPHATRRGEMVDGHHHARHC
jgi:hypothetical protein